MYTVLVYFIQFIIKRRNGMLMITAEMPSETSATGGTVDDVLSWAVIVIGILISYLCAIVTEVYEVKVCRCDVEIFVSEIAGNRQRL